MAAPHGTWSLRHGAVYDWPIQESCHCRWASELVDPIFSAGERPLHTAEVWLGTLAYTFQLYFDFSGYSDMALGIGRMFGLFLPANFYSPYKSRSIAEFWRRWHMSLSFFVRDYVYSFGRQMKKS